jgi:hypothetical protein
MILRLVITEKGFKVNNKPVVNIIDPDISRVALFPQEFFQVPAGNGVMLKRAPGQG